MNLEASDEQAMLRDSARGLLSQPSGRKAGSGGGFDRDLWRRFAQMGWLGLPIAEAHGGFGGSAADIAVLAAEMGRAAIALPYVHVAVLTGGLIETLADDAQRDALLSPLVDGTALPVLAHLENGAGGDIAHVRTRAVHDGSGFRIVGEKVLAVGAPSAETLLVTARISETDELALFALPASAPGIAVARVTTIDGLEAGDVRLDGVRAEVNQRLAAGDVLAALEAAHARAIAALCADAVGAMDALLAATVDYTKQRVQFGKPLASFQALQHRMAEMAVKCEEARASALLAALSADAPPLIRTRGVSGAKAKIGKLSRQVAQEAIQLHGAIGFSQEMPIGTWFRRLYAFEHSLGSTADHLQRYAAIATHPDILGGNLLRERGAA
jgi:alkylation response protein AidB-like acyl-CoA dehydrogenase